MIDWKKKQLSFNDSIWIKNKEFKNEELIKTALGQNK